MVYIRASTCHGTLPKLYDGSPCVGIKWNDPLISLSLRGAPANGDGTNF